jgi:hypothetical protein
MFVIPVPSRNELPYEFVTPSSPAIELPAKINEEKITE